MNFYSRDVVEELLTTQQFDSVFQNTFGRWNDDEALFNQHKTATVHNQHYLEIPRLKKSQNKTFRSVSRGSQISISYEDCSRSQQRTQMRSESHTLEPSVRCQSKHQPKHQPIKTQNHQTIPRIILKKPEPSKKRAKAIRFVVDNNKFDEHKLKLLQQQVIQRYKVSFLPLLQGKEKRFSLNLTSLMKVN